MYQENEFGQVSGILHRVATFESVQNFLTIPWHDTPKFHDMGQIAKIPWLFTDLEKILFFLTFHWHVATLLHSSQKKKELDICLFIMWTTISTSVNEIVWLSISTCADLSPVFTHSSQLCKLSISYITLLANLSHVNLHCTCSTGMNISMILFVQHALVSSISFLKGVILQ